jgi:UDP-glucose 4-epimerase
VGQRVVVTGGAGFIGSSVCRELLARGCVVSIYDAFVVNFVPDPSVAQPNLAFRLEGIYSDLTVIRGSTNNKDTLRRALSRLRPDAVVHMAAMPLAKLAIENSEEAFQSIVTSTVNLLEIMRDLPHPCRLVYVSSSMVYGDFQTELVGEEHPRNPKDVYGAFKLAGEVVVAAYARNYGLDVVTCRPSAVYGPRDTNNRVIQTFVTRAMRGDPLLVEGDGSMKLDFTHVEDCARGIALCALHPESSGKTFNITRGDARSLSELVDILRRHFPEVRVEHRPTPAHVPRRGTLDIRRARELLGYEPEVTLEEGIARYVEHIRSHGY